MLKAITENDELVNVKATKDGKLIVETGGGETSSNNEVKIINEETNPIPAKITNPVTIPENFTINNAETSPVPVKVLSGVTIPTEIKVNNTSETAIPVTVQNQPEQENETTLNASIQTVGTTATTVVINKKVTSIDIANYSETADITMTIGDLVATIGANIATTLVINKNITNISLTSNEESTKVQLIVKGVE